MERPSRIFFMTIFVPFIIVYTHEEYKIKNDQLIPQEKIVLSPLHIKLGLFTSIVKTLLKDRLAMNYLKQKFPGATASKIEVGIFDGPQIRALYGYQAIIECISPAHLEAREAFQDIVHNFLGNYRSPDYAEKIDAVLQKFNAVGSNMSPKLLFLFNRLDIFPTNLGSESDEQGERFHQEMEDIERRYKGWWDEHLMADA